MWTDEQLQGTKQMSPCSGLNPPPVGVNRARLMRQNRAGESGTCKRIHMQERRSCGDMVKSAITGR
ncbi:hypothetical protein TWF696_002352 [Orbilia brochopaga]|uniref:Uncharacterized protein n=1 Tax=Orbilia brochopaga TaxID=3140254 RepID=A0AAV9U3Z7_9PEZI